MSITDNPDFKSLYRLQQQVDMVLSMAESNLLKEAKTNPPRGSLSDHWPSRVMLIGDFVIVDLSEL